ncbi:MAG: cytochrome c [Gemmatimonadaceae bacterium]|nr:cytochrome c [Gemmatimonadaceae bacterium]
MRTAEFTRRLAVGAGIAILTACGGDKTEANSGATPDTAQAAAATTPPPADSAAPVASAAGAGSMAAGEQVYARCIACHQATGAGVPGAFPPLANSEWVNGIVDRPIAILMHGLQGPITVAGAQYNSMMMAGGTGAPLSDEDIANVLTYVRGSFGNSASPVTTADVARVRAATASRTTPLTVADLEAMK